MPVPITIPRHGKASKVRRVSALIRNFKTGTYARSNVAQLGNGVIAAFFAQLDGSTIT